MGPAFRGSPAPLSRGLPEPNRFRLSRDKPPSNPRLCNRDRRPITCLRRFDHSVLLPSLPPGNGLPRKTRQYPRRFIAGGEPRACIMRPRCPRARGRRHLCLHRGNRRPGCRLPLVMWPRCRQPPQFIHPAAKIDRLKSHFLLALARFSPILGHFAIFAPPRVIFSGRSSPWFQADRLP